MRTIYGSSVVTFSFDFRRLKNLFPVISVKTGNHSCTTTFPPLFFILTYLLRVKIRISQTYNKKKNRLALHQSVQIQTQYKFLITLEIMSKFLSKSLNTSILCPTPSSIWHRTPSLSQTF